MQTFPFIQIDGKWWVAESRTPDTQRSERISFVRCSAEQNAWLQAELENAYADVLGRFIGRFPKSEESETNTETS